MKTLNCSEPILDIDTNCTVKQIYRCPDVSLNHIGIFIFPDFNCALLLFRIKLLVIDKRMFAWTYAFYELVFSNYSLVLPTVDKKDNTQTGYVRVLPLCLEILMEKTNDSTNAFCVLVVLLQVPVGSRLLVSSLLLFYGHESYDIFVPNRVIHQRFYRQ